MSARARPLLVLLGVSLFLAGCTTGQRTQIPVDERFGHRPDAGADEREMVVIVPPDSQQTYFYYAAPFDSVHVRAAPFRDGVDPSMQELPVEVLVKGSFPDACTELHELEQTRTAHIIDIKLRIRRPRGMVCAAVVRPYRFYFMLEGLYRPGHYTMKLNEEYVPFQITAPETQ